jgi:hypothetical protein
MISLSLLLKLWYETSSGICISLLLLTDVFVGFVSGKASIFKAQFFVKSMSEFTPKARDSIL